MSDQERCWQMMQDIGTCMLVTRTDQGSRARPMAAIVRPEDGVIWFLTDADSAKTAELERDPDVCLTFSDGKTRHVSALGHATMTNDRDAVASLWSPAAQAFWPDGPHDGSVHAIQVELTAAEMWDGDNSAVAAVKAVFAAARGERADLGHNAKMNM